MDLHSLKTVEEILEKHNSKAKKSFSQNFLVSEEALNRIIETADISPTDKIIEVGPGLGVLTNELVKKAKEVTSIELDSKIIPILKENVSAPNLTILNQDALDYDPPTGEYKVVANIPYNITSPLLNHFLQAENPPTTMTLLVQKEVAEKMCLLKKNKTSILSLQVALFSTPQYIETVTKDCFHPSPKVDSAIIHLTVHNKIPKESALKVLKIAKQAFSHRRKKLSNTILHDRTTSIDGTRRPETLTIEEWLTLEKEL